MATTSVERPIPPRESFPWRLVYACFAAGASIALAGLVARWGFGAELGIASGYAAAASGFVASLVLDRPVT